MDQLLTTKFVDVVLKLFSYLESYGFSQDDAAIEKSALYAKVTYTGINVAIVFTYDLREKVCDCYLGKVINGNLCTDKSKNGFWSPLYSYLIKTCNFRGGVVIEKNVEYEELKELYEYDVMLRTVGKHILKDDADSFVV